MWARADDDDLLFVTCSFLRTHLMIHTGMTPVDVHYISSSVKNPDAPNTNPRAAGSSSSKAREYPPELRGLFTTRFISANPIELLDYPGQELLFISGRHKESEAVKKEVEKPSEEESKELNEEKKKDGSKKDDEEAIFEEVFGELDLFQKAEDVPGLRALEGEWA